MPYQYQRTPFNTSQQVQMHPQGCHGFASGAKDLYFNGIQFGEPVFAVESGTVVFVRRDAICVSELDPNDPNRVRLINGNPRLIDRNDPNREIPFAQCFANEIVVRGDDEFFTNYVHVLPDNNLTVGSRVEVGTPLGRVDNSSMVTGPHVHLVRYRRNPNFDRNNPNASPYWQNGGTCNWTMFNVMGITPTPSNDWVLDEDSGTWYYYVNGMRQTSQFVSTNGIWYWVNNNGSYIGSFYYYDNTRQYYRLWWTPTQRWYRWNESTWVLE